MPGHGLGSRLVATVEEWAVARGATYIRLEVVTGNAPAVALYRRHGYVDTGAPGELLPSGGRQLVMEKPLRAVGPIGPTQDYAGIHSLVSDPDDKDADLAGLADALAPCCS